MTDRGDFANRACPKWVAAVSSDQLDDRYFVSDAINAATFFAAAAAAADFTSAIFTGTNP
jgi:hypothetical protein